MPLNAAEGREVLSIRSYGLTDIGCRRSNNEDNFLIRDDLRLYAVADGMGGANAGEVASRLALEVLAEVVGQHPQPSVELLDTAFSTAHERIQLHSSQVAGCRGMGTTMVAVLDTPEGLAIASVGDSRAYLFAQGEFQQLTEDQTWIQEVGRKLAIDEQTLRRHPYRHILTQALGVSERLRVQTHRLEGRPGSVLLLSTDGLHGVLEDEEIRLILAQPRKLADRCHSLIEAAKKAGGPDNITVVLLEL
jgi:protein phosphatase